MPVAKRLASDYESKQYPVRRENDGDLAIDSFKFLLLKLPPRPKFAIHELKVLQWRVLGLQVMARTICPRMSERPSHHTKHSR